MTDNVGIQLCNFENTYFAKENDTTVGFRTITGLPYLGCDYHDFSKPLGKIMFCSGIEEELLAVGKALREHELAEKFDFIRSERSLFEILPKGVNKGLAIKNLSEYLKVDIKNTVGIGDYDNDVAMLKTAGLGVAVANASPAALAAADVVTVSNEEHAIAKVIEDLDKLLLRG